MPACNIYREIYKILSLDVKKQMQERHEDVSYLELIYNLHSICEALAYDGLESGCAMLRERLRHVSAAHGGTIPTIDGMILITSLNRSLYDFFQFYMHISFTKCCYENRVYLEPMKSDGAIYQAGRRILSDYYRAFSQSGEICNHLEKARSYIREHLAEKLTLSVVADAIHISSSYLSHIFSQLAGQSFCDYICDERMALARRLLNRTDDTIDEIASRCGFSSPNYFSMVFRKYMGQTPSAYRKNAGCVEKEDV